jgi:UDP-3-O-acyl-N-acetylglucosamine deacetylase
VTLVEHVLASLAGLRIDNCLVELDAVEPPGLDGSAAGFVEALIEAGIKDQPARRSIWCVSEPITVHGGSATLTIYPPVDHQCSDLSMSYFLDYGPQSPIVRQLFTQMISPGIFLRDIAPCRTFLLQAEAEQFRSQGMGSRITAADLLVFGPHGPIENTLRFANEPARHKVLDMVGDLSLLGTDLCGHVVACRSGHPLNVELARALHQQLVLALGRSVAA